MADFKAHLSGGIAAGAVTSAYFFISQPGAFNPTQLTAIFLSGTIGGLLPDLDSDTGKPLAMLFGLISVIIPVIFLKKISLYFEVTPEFLISYFVLAYMLINYVILEIVKRITRHRGIMHSIPFAVLCGEAVFLVFLPSGKRMAFAAGVAVFAGSMIHLILDELHAISFKWGFFPVGKSSSGSALALYSNSVIATLTVYGLAGLCSLPILKSFGWSIPF